MIRAMPRLRPQALIAPILVTVLALAGCGSSSNGSSSSSTAASSSSATTAAPVPPAVNELPAAERPQASQFPAADGRSLMQLGKLVSSTAQFGAATGTFTPGGTQRLGFALTTGAGAYIYAPTAIYVARTPSTPAKGPFLAPDDPMGVSPQFRSKQNSGPGGIAAIYETEVPVPQSGTYTVLAVTHTSRGLVGSPGEIAVATSSKIPSVGQRPPAIATATGGNLALLTTRVPPEQMHSVSFNQALGKRPIALLISTPELCVSRVCGPVTDEAVELQHELGNQITFIHQEVYVDNQPSKGLRPQLKAFHLETEPWLFAINKQGVIVARLEGAFGVNDLRKALEAAIHS
jgi:hypothetical protein